MLLVSTFRRSSRELVNFRQVLYLLAWYMTSVALSMQRGGSLWKLSRANALDSKYVHVLVVTILGLSSTCLCRKKVRGTRSMPTEVIELWLQPGISKVISRCKVASRIDEQDARLSRTNAPGSKYLHLLFVVCLGISSAWRIRNIYTHPTPLYIYDLLTQNIV